ncbi:MAG: carboxyl transferase domain-containing protein [Pseudomonadales bacterium]|nr:carboxyl transferase domain-containing protein [Pseudomonadales bacterium]MDP7358433.1 carboxyl transferase domain-containing protein [Pseudomonadales bacterium]MDP7594889.1 carboxyl transferase domain-containing protein [Pseudomonadales bacterium]HJN50480.1 carboxyl transferase domain-containing protein [Pseudomonadales bacterium]|tara:strand:- start:1889 stop:3424 length:1536 start_codon:yes stop_codon:yes gene_type:complete
MVWEPEIEELNRRKQMTGQMGGQERIDVQHERGKLTLRERLDAFVGKDSFEEIGELAGFATYEDDELVNVVPSNTIIGLGNFDGRKVIINANDFTIRGGVGNKAGYSQDMALEWKLPYVRLLDAVGGSVRTFETIGRTYIPTNPVTPGVEKLLCIVPVVSAAMGSVAGLPAVDACLAHFNVMVKGTSQVFAGGPPVVKAAMGVDITKEELGDERSQVYEGGVIDNLADSEEEAFAMIRQFLSYLPDNVWQMPPRVETGDDPNRREEELISAIPRDKRKIYNARAIVDAVLDKGSFFEVTPHYGRARIVGLGRIDGYPVGCMINNPKVRGGAMDVAAGNKVIRFLQLCDTFHLPMVYLADEPGFMVGLEQQRQGIVRAGAKMLCATLRTRMPWITIIIRQLYGVAGQCHDRPGGMFKRVAWPSGHWGSMHISGGVAAAYRRVIDESDDPEAERKAIEAKLDALASPFRTAEAFNIEEIMDPRDTRPMVCDFVNMAQPTLQNQLGPSPTPYMP